MRRLAPRLLSLLALCACAPASAAAPRSGIAGRTVAAPTCPVERVPPQPGCAPRPISATVRVSAVGRRAPVVVVRSGSDGRFRVRLPAGAYVVRALRQGGSPFPRPPAPRRVRVRRGHFTALTLTYDTGIR